VKTGEGKGGKTENDSHGARGEKLRKKGSKRNKITYSGGQKNRVRRDARETIQ